MLEGLTSKWADLKNLLEEPSELAPETFEPSPDLLEFLKENMRILVVGEKFSKRI